MMFSTIGVSVAVGVGFGRWFLRRARAQAILIEDNTRDIQSEYDLTARDIVKSKQDALAQVELIDKPKKHVRYVG